MHAQRHAVIPLAGFGVIVNLILVARMSERVGKFVQTQRIQILIQHIRQSQHQALLVLAEPLVKCRRRVDVLRNPPLVKPQHRLIAPQTAGPPQLLFDGLDLAAHLGEMVEKPAAFPQTAG